jgi:hypothetical protein
MMKRLGMLFATLGLLTSLSAAPSFARNSRAIQQDDKMKDDKMKDDKMPDKKRKKGKKDDKMKGDKVKDKSNN